jgi:hypothetical protein
VLGGIHQINAKARALDHWLPAVHIVIHAVSEMRAWIYRAQLRQQRFTEAALIDQLGDVVEHGCGNHTAFSDI